MSLNEARGIVKELCYPTKRRDSKYNCKGSIHFPHSHFYDTAITEAIQKWKSFLSWKERGGSGKRFPDIKSYSPVFDSLMFDLDPEGGWITIRTGRGEDNFHIPIVIPNKPHYDDLDEDHIASIQLKKEKDRFVFHLVQKSCSPEFPSPKELGECPIIGVNLGERSLASSVTLRPGCQRPEIVDAEFFDGAEAKELEHREHYIRRKLKGLGKSSEIPKRKWKAQNKRKDLCERIAKEIQRMADEVGAKVAFIGDLKAPNPRNSGTLSRRLSNYPFAKLKKSIKRHLVKAGIFVESVYEGKVADESGTSRRYHQCESDGNTHIHNKDLTVFRKKPERPPFYD